MYKNFFQLRENPFKVNPDPRFLLFTSHIQEALACLTYGVQARQGFILLTGEVGTGKTTLLRKLLIGLHRWSTPTAFIFNSCLNVPEFFEFMMADFGIQCSSQSKAQILMRLNQWLLERYRNGQTAVLIVDEAQNLSAQVLEEIRLLTNLETANEKLLQIVLAGQPELELKLNRPELRQLRQRITLRCKTHPLTLEQTRAYIAERLRIAGGNGRPILTPEAIETAHAYSRGIPRIINLLCEHALISAFVDRQRPIPSSKVEEVAREFGLHEVDPTARPALAPESGENARLIAALQKLAAVYERVYPAEPVTTQPREGKS